MIPRSTLTLISSVKEVTSFLILAMFSSSTSFPRSLFESPNSCFSIPCKLSSRLLIVTFCRSLSKVIVCFSRSIVRLDVEQRSCFSDDYHRKEHTMCPKVHPVLVEHHQLSYLTQYSRVRFLWRSPPAAPFLPPSEDVQQL